MLSYYFCIIYFCHDISIYFILERSMLMKRFFMTSILIYCSIMLYASEGLPKARFQKSTQHLMTMKESFFDLLAQNSCTSLNDLQDQVYQSVDQAMLAKSVKHIASQSGPFESKLMIPEVGQLCAIMRIVVLLKAVGVYRQYNGIVDQYCSERLGR